MTTYPITRVTDEDEHCKSCYVSLKYMKCRLWEVPAGDYRVNLCDECFPDYPHIVHPDRMSSEPAETDPLSPIGLDHDATARTVPEGPD